MRHSIQWWAWSVFGLLQLVACGKSTEAEESSSSQEESSSSALSSAVSSSSSSAPGVVSWNGTSFLSPDGQVILLQGAAFGNDVWFSDVPPVERPGERDYVQLAAIGMNAVRFYMSYKYFEDDAAPYQWKQSGFDWLDSNVSWAKQHGVYLVLNMHVPQGGFQSLSQGAALWDDPTNQQRLKALWYTLAARYSTEATIAGYDLVNEPVVTQSKSQWETLAQALIDTIRQVDTTHLIFVERMNGIIDGSWNNDADMNFPTVTDPYGKTGLTFHFYTPFEFTHQYASWTGQGDGGSYPDSSLLQFGETEWVVGLYNAPAIPVGSTDWTWYRSPVYTVSDTAINLGKPILTCGNVGNGIVWYDSILVEEIGSAGTPVDTLVKRDLGSLSGWYFWTEDGSGVGAEDASEGLNASGSLSITGTQAWANLADNPDRFLVHQGQKLRVSGWMKGENVPAGATCDIRLDFERSLTPVQVRDKAFLASEVDRYYQVAKARGVPVYLGEFGTYRATFEADRGGVRWVSDMVDILQERGISYTYHSWDDDSFGLYYGSGPDDIANSNPELIQLFQNKLSANQ